LTAPCPVSLNSAVTCAANVSKPMSEIKVPLSH
jgi:hypothetical protein